MNAWMAWFGSMGSAVIDFGNPFSGSTALAPDGSRGSPTSELTGYSIVEPDDLDAGATLTKECPNLASGGSLETIARSTRAYPLLRSEASAAPYYFLIALLGVGCAVVTSIRVRGSSGQWVKLAVPIPSHVADPAPLAR